MFSKLLETPYTFVQNSIEFRKGCIMFHVRIHLSKITKSVLSNFLII